MTLDQAIHHYGTATALAKALGVNRSAVSHWKTAGRMPQQRQWQLHVQTAGRLVADKKKAQK